MTSKKTVTIVAIAMMAGLLFTVLTAIPQGFSSLYSFVGSGETPLTPEQLTYDVTTHNVNYKLGSSYDKKWAELFRRNSVVVGQTINELSIPLKKFGFPQGQASLKVWDLQGTVKADFGDLPVEQVTQIISWYNFRLDAPYIIEAEDRLGIEFTGGDAGNYLIVHSSNADPFDTNNSVRVRYNGTDWIMAPLQDVTQVIGYAGVPTSPGPDMTKPKVAITSPPDAATVKLPVTVEGTSIDNVGIAQVEVRTGFIVNGIEYKSPYSAATPLSPGDWSKWSITVNPTSLTSIQARATDTSGNYAWSIVQVTQSPAPSPGPTIDTTPPSVTITGPTAGMIIASNTVMVSGTATDNKGLFSILWNLDGGPFTPVTFTASGNPATWSFTIADIQLGFHTISVKAIDTSGNAMAGQVTFKITAQTPNPTICDPGYHVENGQCVIDPVPPCPAGFVAVGEDCEPAPDPTPREDYMPMILIGVVAVAAIGASGAYMKFVKPTVSKRRR